MLDDRIWSVRELSRKLDELSADLDGGGPSHGRLADLLNDRRGAITWTEIQLLARALGTSVFAVVLPPEDDPDFRLHLARRWFYMPPETLTEQALRANRDTLAHFARVVVHHPYFMEADRAGLKQIEAWRRMPEWGSLPGYQRAWRNWSETRNATILEIQRRIETGQIPDTEELFSDLLYDRDADVRDPANYGKDWREKVRARWLETDLGWMKGDPDVG